MESYHIVSLCVNRIAYKEAIDDLIAKATDHTPGFFVCFANTHMVIEAYRSPDFAETLRSATRILPDGWPVAKSMQFFYGFRQERIAGMDLLPDLLKLSNERKLRLFIFGSTEDVVLKAKERVTNDFPQIEFAGHICPSFNDDWDNQSFIRQINESNPHIVLVALGCPKQEKWMAAHSKEINAALLGIGAALPVFAGVMSRCPKWLRDNGFEWLYRLFQEPRRLFHRYFISNFYFVALFTKELLLLKLGIKKAKPC